MTTSSNVAARRDFLRGAAVFPVAGLACWTILTVGGNAQDWGLGYIAVLAGAVLATGGIIWTLVAGFVHRTLKTSTLGSLAGLVLVFVVGGF